MRIMHVPLCDRIFLSVNQEESEHNIRYCEKRRENKDMQKYMIGMGITRPPTFSVHPMKFGED